MGSIDQQVEVFTLATAAIDTQSPSFSSYNRTSDHTGAQAYRAGTITNIGDHVNQIRLTTPRLNDRIVERMRSHDHTTYKHMGRVAAIATYIAQDMHLPDYVQDDLARAGLAHDAGKLAIPGEVLRSPHKWTEPERAMIMGSHAADGYQLLRRLNMQAKGKVFSDRVLDLTLNHHEPEAYNGVAEKATPRNVKPRILLPLFVAADQFEALNGDRLYNNDLTFEERREKFYDQFTQGRKNRVALYYADLLYDGLQSGVPTDRELRNSIPFHLLTL
jgi:response regulator RpfG family c-di-GMP phosphodiesterase